MKAQRFFADGYVSRDYRCAVVLEEHLKEINNPKATKWCKKILHDYMRAIKTLRDNVTPISREFFGGMVLKHFINTVNKQKDKYPDFVLSLMCNIIKTKYKIEILKKP